MLIKTEHSLDYCESCEVNFIRCKTCGNNCCNAGSGIIDGKDCLDCLDAYDVQDAYWADPDSVEFIKQKA